VTSRDGSASGSPSPRGSLPPGYATEDGVALHYVGTRLHEALSVLPARNAWFVEAEGPGRYRQEAVLTRASREQYL